MPKNAYIGSGGKSRRVKKIYIGSSGSARKVKKGYIGVSGKSRLFYSSGNIWKKHSVTKINPRITYDEMLFGYVGRYQKPDGLYADSYHRLIISPYNDITGKAFSGVPISIIRGYPPQLFETQDSQYVIDISRIVVSSSDKNVFNITQSDRAYTGSITKGIGILDTNGYHMSKELYDYQESDYTKYDVYIKFNIVKYPTTVTEYYNTKCNNFTFFYWNGVDRYYDEIYKREYYIQYDYQMGSYITDVESSDPNAYPTNGVHTDGYWYVKQ